MKRLLVLGAGPAQLGCLESARARGLFVVVVDRNPSAPGFRFADRRAILSVEDERGIDRLAMAERVDGLIAPGIDWPVAIAARVADRLGVAHPLSPPTAVLATSKLRQRERFAEAGVAQPRYELCRGADAAAAAERIGYPCVVKPPDRQGQRGLGLVESPEVLEHAVACALEASRGDVVLLEQLVDGPEVTVNAFSVGGRFHPLTVTDRLVAAPPAFGVALAHAWPSSAPMAEAVRDAAAAAAAAVGVTDGPTYTQVRIGPDGPRVGELAARLGGGHDAELCAAALGVDLNGLALSGALGEEIEEASLSPAPRESGACVRFLVAPSGELREVAGVEQARAAEGVRWVHLYHPTGHRYGPLRHGADRAGAILAVGGGRDDALAHADHAAALLRFDIIDVEALV